MTAGLIVRLSLIANCAVAGALASLASAPCEAKSVRRHVDPLAAFLAAVRVANYRQRSVDGERAPRDPAAFAEMKAYILGRYANVDTTRVTSFSDAGGSVFDCLPQPDATAPPKPPQEPTAPSRTLDGSPQPSLAGAAARARQETAPSCPPGAIPVQRITLKTLMNFATLRDFFRK